MITPVLLCGGSGTRLWPLSRRSYPKQFVPLIGAETLFQGSAKRVTGAGFAAPLVLTNADFRFIVTEQLAEAGIDPGAVLIEPEGRDTAPAILAAAVHLAEAGNDDPMLVSPSDHVVPDTAAFQAVIEAGRSAAEAGRIVTFGITPTHPETAYGYLELPGETAAGTLAELSRFVEKPDEATAQEMLATGRYLWNAGIFMLRPSTLIAAAREFEPAMLDAVERSVRTAKADLGFLRLAPEAWSEARKVSIDFAVMERAQNLSVVPYDGGWSDLGGWDAVWREGERTEAGVGTFGPATAIDCENSLLRSEAEGLEVVGVGLSNIMAIAMPDAVLVADMNRAQDVRLAVDALKAKGSKQAVAFPKDHRPWGWFETLVLSDRFQVKRIHVHPGAALSLQSHVHRSEHWIVVAGTAKVTVDEKVTLLTENQSVYIPLGAVHRMENPGKVPMVLIEVQTGTYLGEDDIIRYEDVYARD